MTSQRVEVLERVDAAAGVIERHSSWAEQHCRLHQEAYEALVAAGVPRLFLPTSLGGLEVDPVTCALACERLANADTAAAWHVMVFNVARLMAAQWPLELVEMLWGSDPDTLVAASGHTPLQAMKSGNGYVINGRQRFVSGCDHASWLLSPVMIGEVAGMAVMPLAARSSKTGIRWVCAALAAVTCGSTSLRCLACRWSFPSPRVQQIAIIKEHCIGALLEWFLRPMCR